MHMKMAKDSLVVAMIQNELEKSLAKIIEDIPMDASWIGSIRK